MRQGAVRRAPLRRTGTPRNAPRSRTYSGSHQRHVPPVPVRDRIRQRVHRVGERAAGGRAAAGRRCQAPRFPAPQIVGERRDRKRRDEGHGERPAGMRLRRARPAGAADDQPTNHAARTPLRRQGLNPGPACRQRRTTGACVQCSLVKLRIDRGGRPIEDPAYRLVAAHGTAQVWGAAQPGQELRQAHSSNGSRSRYKRRYKTHGSLALRHTLSQLRQSVLVCRAAQKHQFAGYKLAVLVHNRRSEALSLLQLWGLRANLLPAGSELFP